MCTHNLCFEQKKNEYPCKPQFYYIKVGCKGSTLHVHVILMVVKLNFCYKGCVMEKLFSAYV